MRTRVRSTVPKLTQQGAARYAALHGLWLFYDTRDKDWAVVKPAADGRTWERARFFRPFKYEALWECIELFGRGIASSIDEGSPPDWYGCRSERMRRIRVRL